MKHLLTFLAIIATSIFASAQVDENLKVKKTDLKGSFCALVYQNEHKIFYAVDLSEMDKATQENFKTSIYNSKKVFPATVVNEENLWVVGVVKSINQNEALSFIQNSRDAAISYGNSTSASEKNKVIKK